MYIVRTDLEYNLQSATNAVSLASNLTSGTGLTIGSSATPTNIYGSSTIVNGGLTVNNGLTVNGINISASTQLFFPSSLPTTISNSAGLGITWNDPVSGTGSGTGRTNFINYGQGAPGGFSFTTLSLTATPITSMTITPTSTNITGNTTITGSLNVSGGLNFNNTTLINNKITNLNQLAFDNISDTADKIILYNSGASATSYTLGVNAGILYYNSNEYHKF